MAGFEKKKARYVLYSKQMRAAIKAGNFAYIDLSENDEKRLRAEMEGFVVRDSCHYCYEYDDYDDKSSGFTINDVPVAEMISCRSGCYSTDDVLGEILVADGHFAGVVLLVEEEGGNGWSNYHRKSYPLLFTDGSVDGQAKKSYSFSGESSSKDVTNDYSLVRKNIKQ